MFMSRCCSAWTDQRFAGHVRDEAIALDAGQSHTMTMSVAVNDREIPKEREHRGDQHDRAHPSQPVTGRSSRPTVRASPASRAKPSNVSRDRW